jgi:hypothetical protein
MPSQIPFERICPDASPRAAGGPIVTSGLVVTLEPGSCAADAALAAIRAAPGLTVGEPDIRRLPVALETDGAEASERCCDWLRALPGVAGVEVVFVHWHEVEDGAP